MNLFRHPWNFAVAAAFWLGGGNLAGRGGGAASTAGQPIGLLLVLTKAS